MAATRMDLAPGYTLVERAGHMHHWIGTCRDLVMIFLYDGSQDDLEHVEVAARVVGEHAAGQRAPVKILLGIGAHGKAPSAGVRAKLSAEVTRASGKIERVSVVVAGEGFAAAIQRGVATSMFAMMRTQFPLTVSGKVSEAVAFLVEPREPGYEPLVRSCEGLLRGPPVTLAAEHLPPSVHPSDPTRPTGPSASVRPRRV